MSYSFEPIGVVKSCYKEKFGIPRQAGLVKEAAAEIRLPLSKFRDAFSGLEEFSHIWVIFVFHQVAGAKLRVRPPRMGGAKKQGVFATRSPHRPNPIGISAVELLGMETSGKDLVLRIRGMDLLDETPVLDIKPYIRYADSIPRARSAWAEKAPQLLLKVRFSKQALTQCQDADPGGERKLKQLITKLLKQDPRPAFQRNEGATAHYAFRLAEFDVHWEAQGARARVTELRVL